MNEVREQEVDTVAFWGDETNRIITSVELRAELFTYLSDEEILELFRHIREYITEINNEKEIN